MMEAWYQFSLLLISSPIYLVSLSLSLAFSLSVSLSLSLSKDEKKKRKNLMWSNIFVDIVFRGG
jgi:hypothetical protein